MNSVYRRPGFTLVELLVVASIFAMLFGMIALGARPNPRGQVRLAAQQVASVLLATQTRALGSGAGAGLIFESSGVGNRQCITIFNGDIPPYLEGTATGMPPATLSDIKAAVSVTPTNGAAADLQNGYRIQFYKKGQNAQPAGAWMGFTPPGTATLRTLDGQTSKNTIWPKPAGGTSMDVRVACYPKPSSTALVLPKSAAIDLKFSGIGDSLETTWGTLENKGNIGLVYDTVGGLDTLMQQVTSATALRTIQPYQPTSPFFLFIVSRNELNGGMNTLSSDQSLWVVVHPQTGRVTVSSNIPQSDITQIALARTKARNGIPIGK
ncbi:MAG: prepilin-type N-terminal cleavage/methylation domain-containing protein [Planctomycetota bacterium]|nr:MAG: prepilin-type N-terminal cleavage/methylation domain-containing protein [Planctomycetota bacterium]